MAWIDYALCFVGGAVLANAVPHFVSGVMGRPFRTPFARNRGLSPPEVNVLWGLFNVALAYVVLRRANFDAGSTADVFACGAGMLAAGILLARIFARPHASAPEAP